MPTTRVTVQYSSGTPAKGQKVVLSISGILTGGVTPAVYTNDRGVAIIDHSATGEAKIIVNGTTKRSERVPCDTVVFI